MIREAIDNDIDAICRLSNEINAEHYDAMPEDFCKPEGAHRDASYWLGFMAQDHSKIFLVARDGHVLGFCAVSIPHQAKPPFITDKLRCFLSTIVITRSARRHGLGRKLINTIEQYAHLEGATDIVLEVMHFNQSAIGFYRSIGYGEFSTKLVKSILNPN